MFRHSALRAIVLVFLALIAETAAVATVELVSKASFIGGFDNPYVAAMTPDGRYIVFLSPAPNVIPGQADTNSSDDVFVQDRMTGATTLVTHVPGSPNTASPANGNSPFSTGPDISADGRYVVFDSTSRDLVPGVIDRNFTSDVFLYDRLTDTTTLVSHAAGLTGETARGRSDSPRISADGNYVVFASEASDVVDGQTESPGSSSTSDLFLYHRPSGSITLISRKAGSPSTTANRGASFARISTDGSTVVFLSSSTDLVSGLTDINSGADLFFYQRATGTVSLVSRANGSPLQTANAPSSSALYARYTTSPDGRWIVFTSSGTNLIAGQVDTPNSPDVFLFDRSTGEMRLVSRAVASPRTAGGGGGGPVSDDGRYVAFASTATNLVPGQVDTNGKSDVFVYDRVADTMALVSHARSSQSTAATLPATLPDFSGSYVERISADGRYIAFTSSAVNLVPGQTDNNQDYDAYLYDRVSRTAVLVSHTRSSLSTAANAASRVSLMSPDGKVIFFSSGATDLVEGPVGRFSYFAYRRDSAEVTVLQLSDPDRPSIAGHGWSSVGDISADGRYTVFNSLAVNLVPGQIDEPYFAPFDDPGATQDVFLRDNVTGQTTLITRAPSSPLTTTTGYQPILSADGKFIAFLTPAGSPPSNTLRLYDRTTGTSVLVNHAPGSPAVPAGNVLTTAISADGRYLAFSCRVCNLVPGQQDGNPGEPDGINVFLYDRVTGSSTLVSHRNDTPLTPGDHDSILPKITPDGRFVVFSSQATNLIPGQAGGEPGSSHVFVFDRTTGEVKLVSRSAASAATVANQGADSYGISADGRWILLASAATDLVPGQADTNGDTDAFLHDRISGTTVLVSHTGSSPLTTGDGESFANSISADGRWISFSSDATGLVPGVDDTNGEHDLFLFDRVSGVTTLVSYASGSPQTTGNLGSGNSTLSPDGSRIVFFSNSRNLVPGATLPSFSLGLFVQDLRTGARSFLGPAIPTLAFIFPNHLSFAPRVSANGRRVAFTSAYPVVPGDFNDTWDVYLWSDGPGTPGGPIPLPACKLLDTRRRADRPVLASNVQRTVTVRGACGVPALAKRVVVKMTALSPSGKGNLRFYPGAVTATPSGILRFERNVTRTETFTLPLSPSGTLTILPFVAGQGTVHGAVEVTGYLE